MTKIIIDLTDKRHRYLQLIQAAYGHKSKPLALYSLIDGHMESHSDLVKAANLGEKEA